MNFSCHTAYRVRAILIMVANLRISSMYLFGKFYEINVGGHKIADYACGCLLDVVRRLLAFPLFMDYLTLPHSLGETNPKTTLLPLI